jgi:hypothetical protein
VKIPATFRIYGTEWRVVVVQRNDWKDGEDCLGVSDFNTNEIRLLRRVRDSMEHIWLHELTHVVLAAMGSKLQTNEAFVDQMAGLFHQALTTGK